MGAFVFASLAVRLILWATLITARSICGTARFAYRWPWTFMLTVLGFCAFLYFMAGVPL